MNHKKNYEKYKIFEDKFIEAVKDHSNVNSSKASENEDINEHWDIKLDTKFDVKAIRKTNRNDKETNENIHWVELKNVLGKRGWLYGDADYFAFETIDYWIIVDKISLQNFIAEKCKNKEHTNKPELYKLYNRENRKDIITMIKTLDLTYIATIIIKKI